ncbi:uncharacterized protein B0T15DRAFT_571788 [Chaetomium strumarium]|uniref:Uncharacterized protein n=1 Tax=Chaetomium strumarium TaxID=1170767 RepID=A0AAJ0M710_9PEZI|nr:hypothetical protein B0T15DRAFT_571788 [Chaetomium strumarium]
MAVFLDFGFQLALEILDLSKVTARRLQPLISGRLQTTGKSKVDDLALLPEIMFLNQQSAARGLQQPDGSESNDSSTGKETGRQPTYTTVGSIYNPKTVTPIQPPARRPRARRYPQPIRSPSGETYIPFPNALLSALPFTEQTSPSPPPTRPATLLQYSPLQQNYERAINPTSEREMVDFTGSELPAPAIRSGNLPSPAPFEGNDGTTSEDSLTSRITVKSLTNLASYENPMQKAAQKALARARTANLNVNRVNTPFSSLSTSTEYPRDRLPPTYGATLAIVGPPQPLTAGPPGQRRFRPSVLEPVCKARDSDSQVANMPLGAGVYRSQSPPGLPRNFGTSILAALDDDDETTEGTGPSNRSLLDETYHAPVSPIPPVPARFRPLYPHYTPGGPESFIGSMNETKRKVYDTLPPERIQQYYPNGFPHSYDGQYTPIAEDWYTRFPITENQTAQKPSSDSEHINKTNQRFYAGTEGLFKHMSQTLDDHNRHSHDNKVGVIGGERQRLRAGHIEKSAVDGKLVPPAMSVEEANEMEESDATEPLLNMAFASLLSYKEASQNGTSPFTKADDSLIDHSEKGNQSFFSESKEEEQPKKKKVVKRSRRGY